jgi:hypothetical protein
VKQVARQKGIDMSTRNILIAVTAAAVISAATACGTSSSPPSVSNAASTPNSASASAAATTSPAQPTAAAGAQSCAALGGTVDTDQRCQVQITTANYEIGFNFPVDYPDQQTVTDYLTRERDEFIDFVADAGPRDYPYSLAARATAYHSGTPTSGTESLVFTRNSDTGAHTVTRYNAFTYDLGKGVPITLDTLFKPGTQPVEMLDPIVRRELEKKSQGQESPMSDNTLGARMYENFAITDEAVIFFIGQGAWLSQLGGPQQISVPRAELASVLA